MRAILHQSQLNMSTGVKNTCDNCCVLTDYLFMVTCMEFDEKSRVLTGNV